VNQAESRLYPLLVGSLSVALLASGAALLLWMLATTIGSFRFLADQRVRTGPATLWLSSAAAQHRGGRAEAWRKLWADFDTRIPLRESPRLGELLHAETPLVLIPDARTLSFDELARLKGFVRAGGAAIVTGTIGVATRDATPESYQPMRDFLGVASVRTLPTSATRALYAGVRGPLNGALLPGQPLRLRGQDGLVAVADPTSDLRWRVTDAAAASRRLELGAGRLVWLAAGPQHRHRRDLLDQQTLEDTLAHAVAWAQRTPALSLLPWPGAAAFAGQVELDHRGEQQSAEGSREALLAEIEAARQRAEHVVLYIPVAALGERRAFELAREMDGELKRRRAWIASSDDVSRWNRSRSSVASSVERVGPLRLLVRVTNRGEKTLRDVGLRIQMNRPVSALSISATELGQKVPALLHRAGAESADFVVGELRPGGSHGYTIDFEFAEAERSWAFSPDPNDPV